MAVAARLVDLKKDYVLKGETVHALRGVTFDVPQGDYVSIMGPSGSGKSTLLNLIAGIDKPDSGELLVGGVDITRLGEADLADWRAQNIGFIFQFYNLMPVLTAFENVELPLQLTELTRAERRERVELLLRMVGLSDRTKHYPNELSGGQQQRVAIARALASGAKIIIADEPTGNLDHVTGEQIIKLLFDLRTQDGASLLLVTHDRALAERCDRVAEVLDGRIVSGAHP
jgi:putative ABC transport system ATP-binding protein